MSSNRDFDRIASAWLSQGPNELAERVLDAALEEIHMTNQRRRLPPPWRTARMNVPMRLAAGIAVVTIAGLGAISILRPVSGPGETPSIPSVRPHASTPVTALNTSRWVVYRSERYGFDIKRPADFAVIPATRTWDMSFARATANAGGTLETFTHDSGPADYRVVNAWSVAVPPGTSLDEWVQVWCAAPADLCESGAFASLDRGVPVVTADGHAGVMQAKEDAAVALVLVRDRVYAVAAWGHFSDSETHQLGTSGQLIEAFVSTLQVRPAGAVP